MPETLLNKTGNGVVSQMLTQESKKCLLRLISRRPLFNVHACNVVDKPPEGVRHHSTIFNKAFSLEKNDLRWESKLALALAQLSTLQNVSTSMCPQCQEIRGCFAEQLMRPLVADFTFIHQKEIIIISRKMSFHNTIFCISTIKRLTRS